MAIISGIDGKVVVGVATILDIEEWIMDVKHNLRTYVVYGQAWEQKLKGVRGAKGSIRGFYNSADTTGQIALQSAALNGTTVALKLYYDSSNYYTIAIAYISNLTVHSRANGDVVCEFDYEVSGAVA